MSRAAPQRVRLAGLDGLRALAALTVVSYHVARFSAFVGPLPALLWELKGGVALFFVISGTVLYLPYARTIRDGERLPDWRIYAGRRAVRILPAYWIALTVVAAGPFAAGVFGPDLWRYYGLSQIYSPDTLFSGLGGAWSLCVEVTFYALLPLFARGAAALAHRLGSRAGLRRHLFLIGLPALASVLLRGALTGSLTAPIQDQGVTLSIALSGFLDWFAIGMALAVLAAEREAGRAGARLLVGLAARPRWCVVLALLAFAVGIPAQHGDMFLPWYGLLTHVALGVGSGLLVLAAIGRDGERASSSPIRRLGSSCLTWLGTISYGIYLWHLVVLELITSRPAPRSLEAVAGLWLAVVGGAVLLGAASYYLVERPSQRWLRARESRLGRSVLGGRMTEMGGSVHSTLDPLNSAGQPVDQLA